MYVSVDGDLTILTLNQLCLPEEYKVLDRLNIHIIVLSWGDMLENVWRSVRPGFNPMFTTFQLSELEKTISLL